MKTFYIQRTIIFTHSGLLKYFLSIMKEFPISTVFCGMECSDLKICANKILKIISIRGATEPKDVRTTLLMGIDKPLPRFLGLSRHLHSSLRSRRYSARRSSGLSPSCRGTQ